MTDELPDGLPPQPPTIAPPPPFVDRRKARRRTDDRAAHQETVLLSRTLDVLAAGGSAEERLAGLLRLLARTVGARRVAVVADGSERRAAVSIDPGEDPAAAEALAVWLDAQGPRSRARRAASGQAPISFIVGGDRHHDPTEASPIAPNRPASAAPPTFAVIPIPTAGDVALGFEFARPADAELVTARLPATMARHAAVALALVTSQLADERELATLRSRETERTAFVSTVAHELRTPLTGLRGYLELILGGQVVDREVEREFLGRSRSIVSSLADLVGDLLELSRLESGTMNLEVGPFSIAEAGSQVAANLLPIAIDHGIRLTTSLPPRLRVARGDRRRVEQIVTNLAANALKFTPEGGHVEIAGEVHGVVAILVVRDDGRGIPAEDRARIFERFHRMADHERVAGTGLGLPIARDLARRMAGDLDVASVPGSGSSFVLVLPGPADASPDDVRAALATALEREELGLEERVVRRAIDAMRADHFDDRDADSRPEPTGGRSRRAGAGRLRALPSIGPGERTPA